MEIAGPTIDIHTIAGILLLIGWVLSYWKSKKENDQALGYLGNFFLTWALFCLLGFILLKLGNILKIQVLQVGGLLIPTFLLFLGLGYLWKYITSFKSQEYQKLFWGWVIFGIFVVVVDIWKLSPILLSGQTFRPFLQFRPGHFIIDILIVGRTGTAIGMVLVCLYLSFLSSDENRKKFIWLAFGIFVGLIFPHIPDPGYLGFYQRNIDMIWIPLFYVFPLWDEISNSLSKLRSYTEYF